MTGTAPEAAETKRVIVTREDHVGWLRIDNPGRLNAMSFAMWGQLEAGVATLAADDEVRVIIVAGHDGRAFCAGGDISEFGNLRSGAASRDSYDAAGSSAMLALREVGKPTIAIIEGYCLGGGLGMALQCDLRFAAESARLGIPAAKRGIAYDFKGVKQLVDLVGPSRAKDILYTARQVDGREAQAMGLVNAAVPEDRIRDYAGSVAEAIARNAPLSIRASKMMVGMAVMDALDRDMDRCVAAEKACLESADYREATSAFMEKRPSRFTGN